MRACPQALLALARSLTLGDRRAQDNRLAAMTGAHKFASVAQVAQFGG